MDGWRGCSPLFFLSLVRLVSFLTSQREKSLSVRRQRHYPPGMPAFSLDNVLACLDLREKAAGQAAHQFGDESKAPKTPI